MQSLLIGIVRHGVKITIVNSYGYEKLWETLNKELSTLGPKFKHLKTQGPNISIHTPLAGSDGKSDVFI